MSPRLKKLIGWPMILAILVAWCWAAVSIGERLPQAWWTLALFYSVAGIGWSLPVMPLMAWMNRGER